MRDIISSCTVFVRIMPLSDSVPNNICTPSMSRSQDEGGSILNYVYKTIADTIKYYLVHIYPITTYLGFKIICVEFTSISAFMLLSHLSVKAGALLAFVKNQRKNGKVKKFQLFCVLLA